MARFFIPQQVAIQPNMLLGDDRGFSFDPAASFRIALAWDTETGMITYTVDASRVPGGWVPVQNPHFHADVIEKMVYVPPQVIPARGIGQPGGGNGVSVNAVNDGLVVDYSGLNSLLPCCSVHGRVTMRMTSSGIYVNLNGNRYPNFEAIQYSTSSDPRFLAQSNEGPGGGINTIPGMQGFRDETWLNGNMTSASDSYPFEGWLP